MNNIWEVFSGLLVSITIVVGGLLAAGVVVATAAFVLINALEGM